MARKISAFVKLEHTLFSLPLLFAGAFLALPPRQFGAAQWVHLGLILVAGMGARTLALALNRLLDRKIDAKNPRTQNRELPSGKLSPRQGWMVAAAGAVAYLWAAWMLGPLCLKLSPIPVVVFTLYPLMKRFTFLAHLGVGAALALAPLGGWVGMLDAWPTGAAVWLFSGITLLWVAGFDILYAIDDLAFDRAQGLHSIPAAFGERAARQTAKAMHLACVVMLFGMVPLLARGVLQPVSLWRTALLSAAAMPAAVLILMQQQFSNSLEPGSPFFRINAWTGVALAAFVLAGMI